MGYFGNSNRIFAISYIRYILYDEVPKGNVNREYKV